jgi:hypothetical protein
LPREGLVLSARFASAGEARAGTPLAAEYFWTKYCVSCAMSVGRSRSGGIFKFN